MFVEINPGIKEGVIVKKGDGFIVVPFDEFMMKLKNKVKSLEEKVRNLETITKEITTEKPVEKVKALQERIENDEVKERLVRISALELLTTRINTSGENYPDNYADIVAWVVEFKDEEPPAQLKEIIEQLKKRREDQHD